MNFPDLFLRGLLIAEPSRWESLGGAFRDKNQNYTPTDILVGLGACLAGVKLLWFLLQFLGDARKNRMNCPRRLFLELCAVHGLSRPQRRLLMQVAGWQRLAQPARLFLEPERFDPVNLSPALRAQQMPLEELRGRLFASPDEPS